MLKNKFNHYLATILIVSGLFSTAEAQQTNSNNIDDYQLEQIVAVSRHGLRAPLSDPNSYLGRITPNQWPQWDTPAGDLTINGGTLESYLGHYLKQWLVDNKLIDKRACPTEQDLLIYTNSVQRTIATGQYLALGMFPGCDVVVQHKYQMNAMDELFSPLIADDSPAIKQQLIDSINQKAGTQGVVGLNQELLPAYQLMADIIDYQHSPICEQDKQCDFIHQPTEIKINKGKAPDITGPLNLGNAIADALVLQYYEGIPITDIGWGQVKTEQQLAQLLSIRQHYNEVIFAAPDVAKRTSHKLITRISDLLTHPDSPKVTFLVGHDGNLLGLFSAINVEPYQLNNQLENTPVGGKVVFERWKNRTTGEQMIKMEYIYQSNQQMNQLQQLNKNNPALHQTLSINGCPTDSNGFCSYQKFIELLNQAVE